jgi:hypothetical protein
MIYKVQDIKTEKFLGDYGINNRGKQWKSLTGAVKAADAFNRSRLQQLEFVIIEYETVERRRIDPRSEMLDLNERRKEREQQEEISRLKARQEKLKQEQEQIKNALQKHKTI